MTSLRRSEDADWSQHGVASVDLRPVERDPLRGQRGTTVLPSGARKRLSKVRSTASGVTFQRMAIAHELDPDRTGLWFPKTAWRW